MNNERIKELVEQAGYLEGYFDNDWEWHGHDFNTEKFAQLIIEDCLAQCNAVRDATEDEITKGYTPGFVDGLSAGAFRIKCLIIQKFGHNPFKEVKYENT
jgi:hypothetical protein